MARRPHLGGFRKLWLLLVSAGCVSQSLAAQQQPIVVGSELDQYLRLLELEGAATGTPLVYRSSSLQPGTGGLVVNAAHPWQARYALSPPNARHGFVVTPLDADAMVVYNSAFPHGTNDGALWAGRGLSATVSAGVQVGWGPFTARLDPQWVYAENRTFDLAPVTFAGGVNGRSVYSYPWETLQTREIDWPQRFGDGSIQRLDWGQSGLRVDAGTFTAGWSTENLWWGPGYRNAIIMSNTAAGFPHVDIGTGRPAHTPIGNVEVRAIWGRLTRSDYFGTGYTDGHRLLNGLTLGYQPPFLPGLTLGITRAFYQEWPAGRLGLAQIFGMFSALASPGDSIYAGVPTNDLKDGLASLTARWVLPAAGFEMYLEWARNDFGSELRDLLMETDHSRGFTVGFQKTLPARAGRWRLAGEFTTLSLPPTILYRPEPSYYMHGLVIEGYTQRGQLLGAGIGPGSNSQFLGLDRYSSEGRWGVFIERVRHDDDAFYYGNLEGHEIALGRCVYLCHDLDLSVGASVLRFRSAFDIGGNVEVTRELSRYFIENNDLTNLKLGMVLKWRPK